MDSDFVVSRTPITGGSASSISSLLQPWEALSLNRSRCVVTGLARTRIAAGAKAGATVRAVVGVGEILAHPNVLLGRRLVWQAISGTATNGFLLSNPDTFLIH